jgi:hypothetical protein
MSLVSLGVKSRNSQFDSFRAQAPRLATLEFIQVPEAERLTFEYLDSTNLFIRGALGLIAAKRWPNRLMTTALSHEDERINCIAAITVFHPDMLAEVRSLIPPQELDKRLAKLKGNPVEVLVPNASIASLVF